MVGGAPKKDSPGPSAAPALARPGPRPSEESTVKGCAVPSLLGPNAASRPDGLRSQTQPCAESLRTHHTALQEVWQSR